MKLTYTVEALADLSDALSYLNERSPAAATKLRARVDACVEHLANGSYDGPTTQMKSGAVVQSWAVVPFRVYYQRLADELVILRFYHQARKPIERSWRRRRR